MFKSLITTAFRNLLRHKFHSIINILGLAIGIACTFVITLFILDETSFDRHHSKANDIYRIAHKRSMEGSFRNMATTPLFLGEKLKSDFPSINRSARFMGEAFGSFRMDDKLFPEPRFCFADEAILEIFNIPLLRGNPSQALSGPNSLIISEDMAHKYFGNGEAMGQVLTWVNWGREYEFSVTGVFENIPENSHFQFDFFTPYDTETNLWKAMHGEDWHYSGAWTYVELAQGNSPEDLTADLNQFAQTQLPSPLNESTEFYLQPLLDIHLHSNLASEIKANGNITTVYIFTVIALLVLVISCINFVNLTTARALTRSKEVGIRKAIGAFRSNLILQFITESIAVSLLAAVIALLFSALALPFFNSLAEKNITLFDAASISKIIMIPAIALMIGMLAGLYPALFLSGFKPVKALKSNVYAHGENGIFLRKGLVILQFSISIILLIGIGTISKQLRYLKNKELGFEKEQIIFINGYNWQEYAALKTELEANPDVMDITGGSSLPGTQNATPIIRMARPETNADEDRLEVHIGSIDAEYFDVLGMNLATGRYFSRDMASDPEQSIVVNEAFLRQAGITASPLGSQVAQYDMMGNYANTKTIVGVLEDFHMESLHGAIRPVIYNLNVERHFNTVIKLSQNSTPETIDQIRQVAGSHSTGTPIDVYFLDQDIERLYQREDKLSQVISLFTGLALLVSCMGLLGLASFTMAQKTKEIGIRKVLGASVLNLLTLLTRQLTLTVIIAFLIGAPIAWYLSDLWLADFAYRTRQSLGIFLAVAIITILITWLTIGFQSFKAALVNPVKSLRDE